MPASISLNPVSRSPISIASVSRFNAFAAHAHHGNRRTFRRHLCLIPPDDADKNKRNNNEKNNVFHNDECIVHCSLLKELGSLAGSPLLLLAQARLPLCGLLLSRSLPYHAPRQDHRVMLFALSPPRLVMSPPCLPQYRTSSLPVSQPRYGLRRSRSLHRQPHFYP